MFLCGDVMTGRGVDQVLPHPSGRQLFEPYVRDARDYVTMAESRNGPIPKPVSGAYVWGDALAEFDRVRPDARVVNLETSVTSSDDAWPDKGINYRMHPENIECLTAARIDVCELANNHVLDYNRVGLEETLEILARAGIRTAGAGRNLAEAQMPAIVPFPNTDSRVLVFALATGSAGVLENWAAGERRSGVDLLADLSDATAAKVVERIGRARRPHDLVIASIHWGSNWGYEVPPEHVRFARRLVDGGVDVVHGHSSHHPRPIEVYRNRLILYGCGDFINDYEGIAGHEEYRDDLVLMYFAAVSLADHSLAGLEMRPMQLRRIRLNRASQADTQWTRDVLERINTPYGSHVDLAPSGMLILRWSA